MSADLPPSSRKRRLRVGAPFSMIRAPDRRRPGERDEVDPGVGDQILGNGVVGRGHHLEDAGGEVGPLRHQAADAGGVPRRVRRRLEDHRVPGGQRLSQLVDGHLEGIVPRDDGGHHAHRLLGHLAPTPLPKARALGEVALPLELVDELGRPA